MNCSNKMWWPNYRSWLALPESVSVALAAICKWRSIVPQPAGAMRRRNEHTTNLD